MSQVFAGDSVNGPGAGSVTLNAETIVVTGNFVNPPFQNAKAAVSGNFTLVVGASATSITLRIRRNPNAENVQIAGIGTVNVTAGNTVAFSIQGADPIPDGRPVQYALTVQQTGATGNATLGFSNISTLLISG